ncbi:hypothetical protein BAQ48_00445 [Bacillus luti]|nr:hypothetical protein BAQ48_00445 [Bacillus luti]
MTQDLLYITRPTVKTKEEAEIFNVAPSTVFTYIKSGKLPASKIEKREKSGYKTRGFIFFI